MSKAGNSKFGVDYAPAATVQDEQNQIIIKSFGGRIKENFIKGHYSMEGINIIDLGCGHGKPTYDLLKALQTLNIPVKKIIGYDLSEQLIAKAIEDYGNIPELQFKVQNMETISNIEEFDIAVSFFALQWADNISHTAELIAKALKPQGTVMFIMPLDRVEFFKSRQEYLENNREHYNFSKDFNIQHTIFEPEEYTVPFSKYISEENLIISRNYIEKHLTFEEMTQFTAGWMPEVHFLSEKGASKETQICYVKDFLSNIFAGGDPNLHYNSETDDVTMKAELFFYIGEKNPNLSAIDLIGSDHVDNIN